MTLPIDLQPYTSGQLVIIQPDDDDDDFFEAAGGEGSGNYGHADREGERGGSATGGFKDAGPEDSKRMKELKLPPAWKNVKLNPNPSGALQATGEDAKGRTQYRYSAQHSEEAAAEKFERLGEFHEALPTLREATLRDLDSEDDDVRDSATVTYLIDKTAFRVGSDRETFADKKAHGATTLEAKHVKIDGDKVSFKFVGKKGVLITKTLEDEKLARALRPRVESGGRLFSSKESDVRDYIASKTPGFTPKDFRTYHGTYKALDLVGRMRVPKTAKAYKQARNEVGDKVAKFLGNTRTVALASYIAPSAFSRWKVPS